MEKGTTYVALDDSKRKIVAGILRPGDTQPELREIANDPRLIRRLFERLQREGPVVACYEAGVSGYDLRRQLVALGVACDVIAPALTPRRPGQRPLAVDPRAAVRPAAAAARLRGRPPRARASTGASGRARQGNRGPRPPSPIASPWAGCGASAGSTRCRRSSCWPRSSTSSASGGRASSWPTSASCPSEYSSGDSQRRGALTKAGNSHARRVLVEAAWHYRHRPTIGGAVARRSRANPTSRRSGGAGSAAAASPLSTPGRPRQAHPGRGGRRGARARGLPLGGYDRPREPDQGGATP